MGGRRFQLAALASIALMTMACAAAPSLQTEIATLEASLVMPDGADPLESYARFYTVSGNTIEGEYINSGMLRSVLEDRVVSQRLAPNVFLVDQFNMPSIMDGGCSVLTVQYDRRAREHTGPFCNGLA